MVVCGWMVGVGGSRSLSGVDVGSLETVSGCCARKAAVAPCCSVGRADCCVVGKSERPMPLPAVPVPLASQALPDWMPAVAEHLELPDLARVCGVTARDAWLDGCAVVPVPLFLRDRVFLI